jgi:hypothetical protein
LTARCAALHLLCPVRIVLKERVFGRFRRINEPDCKAVTLYANIDVREASRAIQVRDEAAMHVEAAADNSP